MIETIQKCDGTLFLEGRGNFKFWDVTIFIFLRDGPIFPTSLKGRRNFSRENFGTEN